MNISEVPAGNVRMSPSVWHLRARTQAEDGKGNHLNDVVSIIPGQEIEKWSWTENKLFRFVVHGCLRGDFVNNSYINGIEVENTGRNWHMDQEKIRQVADRYGLLPLSTSDAREHTASGDVDRMGTWAREKCEGTTMTVEADQIATS